MLLKQLVEELGLKPLTSLPKDGAIEINSAYVSDLLSQVLASAGSGAIWITIQSHMNIVGVAVTANLPAIIVAEDHDVAEEVVKKAEDEGVAILAGSDNAFTLAGKLYERGVR